MIQKKRVLTFFLLSIWTITNFTLDAQAGKERPVRVFITAGQSNTDGRVNNKLLPEYIKSMGTDTVEYTEGRYRFCKIAQNRTDGLFVPYWPKGRITNRLWTYDAVTYYHIEQALQEDFYVIKWAVGGTSIAYPNDTTKGRYWSANPEWLSRIASVENRGKSLLLSFTDAIDAAIDQTLSKIERGYQIDAFLWHQGESDARYAEDYYRNLKAVIAHVRRHLTEKTGNDYSELPFVFGSIPKTNRHYRPVIEAAMQRIAEEDPNAYLIDMSETELQGDRTHFNEKSAEYLGNQMFKIVDRILNLSGNRFRVAKYRGDKACAISYTFDDGLKEHYTLVTPRFKELGFRGTFWINGSRVNADANSIKDTTRVTWDNLKEMAELGHEISNHGWAHKNFGRHTLKEIKDDIYRNDSAIFENIGIMPRTFCYPNNTKTPEGVMIASENRVGTRLLQRSVGGKATHENLEQWVNGLLDSGGWGVAMTHGITYGYDRFSSANIFWEHLKKVKAQEDKIWVGTFQEVVAYLKEWKSISYDVTEKENGFVITPHLTLDQALFTEPLTGVIDCANVKSIIIRQGEKELKARILADKVLFDFEPFGKAIDIEIKNKE